MSKSIELNEEEVDATLERLPGWAIVDGPKLQGRFEFRNFVEAFGFMTKVALIAESMDHHPEWTNIFNVVTINLYKHDEWIITKKDLELATRINRLFAEE